MLSSTSRLRRRPISLAISALLAPAIALAAPTGGVVTSGNATISSTGTVTNIDQSSQKASINWQGFSIAGNETVNFNQPNSSAITLNRVIGNEKSVIDGVLNATGKVFLVNSNGVLFNQGSQVNVGGLVASTLNITDEDFNAGNYVFKGHGGSGGILNLGTITAKDGGYVALLGNNVSNQGLIAATKGTVALSAGEKITLNFNGDSLLSVTIDEGTLNALVDNKKAIVADGGTVFLTAKAADDLLGAQVNNSGVIQARTIDDLKGKIELYAHGGTANVDGTLDASAPTSGDGGFIETSGSTVNVADSAFVTTKAANGKTGTWLIDPNDFVVAASGGNMTGTAVSNALANNNYTIDTHTMGTSGGNGDITINDAITWSSNNTLTLTAERNININNAITANGTSAGLAMNYGGDYNIRTKASYSGTELNAAGIPVARADTSGGVYGSISLRGVNASLTLNGQVYTLIHNIADFAAIDGLSGYFALAGDVDASGTTYANTVIDSLNGTLAGMGHRIDGLTIITPTNYWDYSNTGLIGTIYAGAVVRDLGVTNVNISGYDTIGALAGRNAGTISHVYATGSVRGHYGVGGLVGSNGFWLWDVDPPTLQVGLINQSFSAVAIQGGGIAGEGFDTFGGLVARNMRDSVVTGSHATGAISIQQPDPDQSLTGVGGLIGTSWGSVTDSYASGDVTTSAQGDKIGGLMGTNYGALSNVFATGKVTISGVTTSFSVEAGGLVGSNYNGTINNAYATGDVTVVGTAGYYSAVGGLVGSNNSSGTISNVFATGNVSGTISSAGGLVGTNAGTVTNGRASGNVSSSFLGATIGGLVGYNSPSGSVIGGSASGNVFGSNIDVFAGGLVGSNGGLISGGYASGNIQIAGLNSYAGGLVGINLGTVRNSNANGSVDAGPGTSNGLVGTNEWLENGQPVSGSIIDSSYVDQAAERLAVAQQAYQDAGSRVATTEVAQLRTPVPIPTSSGTGGQSPGRALDESIVFTDNRSFSADVRRIEVDGKVFLLEEDGEGSTSSSSR